ncbi:MAG: hypothetical protein LUQ15_04640 [Methanothrix sp.]|nr:hypothetical protein [Methanothrix sp.]OYV10662.1 MAG: major facilitator transporter [Methanosaeta sp. NSP1]
MSDAKTGRNILLLGLVSLLNDISSEIIQPVLPLFIASLGGGTLAVGLVGGFSEGLPSLINSWLPQKAGWPSFWRKAWKGAAKACDPALATP